MDKEYREFLEHLFRTYIRPLSTTTLRPRPRAGCYVFQAYPNTMQALDRSLAMRATGRSIPLLRYGQLRCNRFGPLARAATTTNPDRDQDSRDLPHLADRQLRIFPPRWTSQNSAKNRWLMHVRIR